jgi:hypothetical protein
VAVPAEIDHDSLNNFVAAEHYDWSSDISGTATINTSNITDLSFITDLHSAGVDGSANQLLTDDGDGSVTSESTLSYTPNTLTIGDTDGGMVTVETPAHDNGDGANMVVKAGSATAGQTDKSGGILALYSGQGTGTGANGEVRVYTSPAAGGTGTSLNGAVKVATFTNDSKLRLDGGTLQGPGDSDLLITSDGNMTFRIDEDNDETSQSFAWQNNASTEIANLDESGNLQIDGDLTVSGNNIKDDDGTTCITFDSSGKTSIATKLTVGSGQNEVLELNTTSATGNPFISFKQDGSRKSFIQHNDTSDTLKIASEFGAISLLTDSGGSETERLGISSAGVVSTSGDLTVGGTLAVGDIDVTSTAGQSLTITAGVYDNPVKIVGGDSKVYTAYSDNSTAGTNTIGVGALGDDSYFRNDEGSFKFYVANDATVAAEITQSGNLTVTGQLNSTLGSKYAKTGNTDGTYQGDVVYFGGTTSMTTGAIYHYKSDGTWELADADAASTCDGLLGVALGAASDTNGVLLRGMVTLDHDPGAVGDVLYVSTTAGDCSATAPSGNGDIVRVIGYCLDASNGQIWFNPDSTFVEITA